MNKMMIKKAEKTQTANLRARKQKGASSVEYIIVLIFVAIAGIVGFKAFSQKFKENISTANTSIDQVKP